MSGEINRFPSSLLSYLDMKSRGQTPRTLAPEVRGMVNLDRWYLEQTRVLSNTSGSPAGTGFVNFGQVPEGQTWVVRGLSATTSIVLPAATTYLESLAVLMRVTAGGAAIFPVTPPTAFATGVRVGLGWQGEILLRPGDQVGLWVHDLTLGTATSHSFTSDLCIFDR